jgi:cell division protein FtsL
MTKYAPDNKRFFLKWQFVALLAVVCFLAIAGVRQFWSYRELKTQVAAVNQQIVELAQKNNELKATVNQYESDAFVESEARNKLNMKKKGETVVVIKNIVTAKVEPAALNKPEPIVTEEQGRNIGLWWKYFFEN